MFDINEAFIQALQKQELEEAIDYKNDRYNATTAEDTADEREFYGKHMTKRDKVRSLDQAKRNLERIGKDPRVTTGQAVDQISFEDTLYTDIANYKDNKNWAKKSAEKGDTLWADEHNKQVNKFADKIRAKHKRKQESASITVTHDVNSENEALDLVNDTSYFNVGDEVEVKDWNGRTYTVKKTKDIKYKNGKRVEEAVENNEKTKLTFAYKDDGQFYYKDEKGRVYVDMSDNKDRIDLYICSPDYNEPEIDVNADDYELINNPKDNINYERNEKYKGSYMLLSRLESDCKYYLGNGNRYDGILWAGSVDKQIAKMKELWNSFPDDMKPEWLSMEDIENYEKEMKKKVENKNKKLKREVMEKEKAEKFGITDNLNKLTNDLMAIKYVTKVDYDLDGYYDNINAPITLVSYNIDDTEDEEYSIVNYSSALRKLKRQVLDVMKNNGVNVEMEEFEDNDTYFYIVAYSTNWNTKKKTEAEETKGATITQELHTDLLPILNMYQYDIADGVEISREELDEVMQDKAMPIIEETIKTILPTAEVKAGKFYNPPYYRFGSGNNDQLDFTVTVPEADYKKLEADTLAKEDFEEFLKNTYKSYDGFISSMPEDMREFEEADDWKQFVAILSYYITPYEHQEEFTADVIDYIWGNFPTEEDEDEYDDETNWTAEEEAEADERFENRYMNGGNGFTADKKDESKEVLKETDADMYKRLVNEPRTEKYEKGLKIRDEIVNAWKNGDLETANKKWEELFDLFSTGYDEKGEPTEEWTAEQSTRDIIERTMITDTIENQCVYDICDYGKQKAYKEMGY